MIMAIKLVIQLGIFNFSEFSDIIVLNFFYNILVEKLEMHVYRTLILLSRVYNREGRESILLHIPLCKRVADN